MEYVGEYPSYAGEYPSYADTKLFLPDCQYPPSVAKYVLREPSPELEAKWHAMDKEDQGTMASELFLKGCPPGHSVIEYNARLYYVADAVIADITP